MSSTEPPTGSVPPEPTDPPASSTPPPPPPPPPPAAPQYAAPQYAAPQYAAPTQTTGVPRPGALLDRFVARLIDLVIVGIVASIIARILAAISGNYVLATLIATIISTAIYLGYFAYFESSSGQTVGKMIMKLKVFGPDGRRTPTMQEAVKRNIWLAASILGIFGLIGSYIAGLIELVAVIVCAVNISSNVPDRRTWFDTFAGGTQVMKIG